jgi:hypothetical protein
MSRVKCSWGLRLCFELGEGVLSGLRTPRGQTSAQRPHPTQEARACLVTLLALDGWLFVAGIMGLSNTGMTVHISDLPENIVADYEAVARLRGIPLVDLLREYLIEHAPPVVTPRAERFASLRERIVASGVPLLNDDELRAEIRERRGMLADTES